MRPGNKLILAATLAAASLFGKEAKAEMQPAPTQAQQQATAIYNTSHPKTANAVGLTVIALTAALGLGLARQAHIDLKPAT